MSWLKKFPSLLQLFGLRKKAGKENVTQSSPAADSPSPAASTPPEQESATRHTEVDAAGNNDECQQSSVKLDSDQPTQVKETSKTTKERTVNRKTRRQTATVPARKLERRTSVDTNKTIEPEPGEYIQEIVEDAKFVFSSSGYSDKYTLAANEYEGIDSRFDDDSQTEIKLGLDVGTSSVKCVIKQGPNFTAIPFLLGKGINAYLLPTVLYKKGNGMYTLDPAYPAFRSSLKLDLLNNPDDEEARLCMLIFLALVLRQVRGWIFENLSKYDGKTIAWECVIGYPSNDEDERIANIWKELLYRAWFLSEHEGHITTRVADEYFQRDLDELDEDIAYDYFQSVPEVCAAVAGFLRNQPIRDDFKGNYTLVDIGSGTVDASCFSFTRSPTEYQYVRSLYSLEVQPLGTTTCHHRRLDWLRALVIEAKESEEFEPIADEWFDRLKQDLNTEEAKTLLSPLTASCRAYYQGIEITAVSPSVDRKFSKKLTELIGRVRHKCMTDHFLTCQDVAKMPVFFCGGGARSKFYRDAFLYKHKNISWLRPERIIESDAISDLQETMTTPILREDYDRLLVAYGLCAEEAPKSIEATHLESEQSTGFQDRYISKDDI